MDNYITGTNHTYSTIIYKGNGQKKKTDLIKKLKKQATANTIDG